MATILSIKQVIDQLDAGSFQNLCDDYLDAEGYQNIVSLGTLSGTRKTTRGTPDTYFLDGNKKYIFAEYTTQKSGLFAKIEDDIKKCFDERLSHIPIRCISEIIYCHTSSNLNAGQDKILRDYCEGKGIYLRLIGIDSLASALYRKYPRIVKDHLNLTIDTEQIQTVEDFVDQHDKYALISPLKVDFYHRQEELKQIERAFSEGNLVVLKGASGVGKTRLALEYAQKYALENKEKLFCIHNNGQSIFEDLKFHLSEQGSYFLLVDDANQLSGLKYIIPYVIGNYEGVHVKVLITVRDYAFEKIANDLSISINPIVIEIKVMKSEEIIDLLKNNLGIKNPYFLDRIVKLAQGNPRIAMLAGKIACETNSIDSIRDASHIYENYYRKALEEMRCEGKNNLLVSAGVVAFFDSIRIDNLEKYRCLLDICDITNEEFILAVKELHNLEIVNIYKDKAVRFADQSLGNYLLKYVFYDQNLINFQNAIENCFVSHKNRTVYVVNTLLSVYGSEELLENLKIVIKRIWNKLSQNNSSYFFDFVEMFYVFFPTDTLLILKKKIDKVEPIALDVCDIDDEKEKNQGYFDSNMLEMLGGLSEGESLEAALDLYFLYYQKRPDALKRFYDSFEHYYSIDSQSSYNRFEKTKAFLRKIKEYSDDWKNPYILKIFWKVANALLKFEFHPSEMKDDHRMTIHRIKLLLKQGVKEYRMLLWNCILEICEAGNDRNNALGILRKYGNDVDERGKEILVFEIPFVVDVLKKNEDKQSLHFGITVRHLAKVYKQADINHDCLERYYNTAEMKMYLLLKGENEESEDYDYTKEKLEKERKIQEYAKMCTIEDIKRAIDVCEELKGKDSYNEYQLSEGLHQLLINLVYDSNKYIEAIRYYLLKNTPLNIYCADIVKNLFSQRTSEEVWEIINEVDYDNKNEWQYNFFAEIPCEIIVEKTLRSLYDFLKSDNDKSITSSRGRNVEFLVKYKKFDPYVLESGCRLILNKVEYSPFIAQVYFNLSFNENHITPLALIDMFDGNTSLIEEIYFSMLKYDHILFDYEGAFLKTLTERNPEILRKYVMALFEAEKHNGNYGSSRIRCYFEGDNYIEIYTEYLDLIFERKEGYWLYTNIAKEVLVSDRGKENITEKQEKLIIHYIEKYSSDVQKMKGLFSVLAQMEISKKIRYYLRFLELNSSFIDFKEIPLTPYSYGWSGSAVPLYSSWIEFLQSLIPYLIGIKWLEHRQFIEAYIEYYREKIEKEELEEFLER